jgi:PAS domain S-box-containing protein
MHELSAILEWLPDATLAVSTDGEVIAANVRLDGRWLLVPELPARIAALQTSPAVTHFDVDSARLAADIAWRDISVDGQRVRLARVRDITEAHAETERLRGAIRVLEDAFDALPARLIILDRDGIIVSGNAAWHMAARVEPRALSRAGIGSNYLRECEAAAARGEGSARAIAEAVREVLDGARRHFETEYVVSTSDGLAYHRLSATALDGGYAMLAHVDVSDHYRRHEHGTDSDVQFKAIFEGALDGIVLFDDDFRIVRANPACAAMLGVAAEQLIGRSLREWVPETLRPQVEHGFDELTAVGNHRGRIILPRAGRDELELEYVSQADVLPGRHVVVVRDVTRAHALEVQLRQSQKMEAIGQLTGGIAHDLNNLLTIVLAEAELMLDSPSATGDLAASATAVRTAARRGADMIRKLLAFARKETLKTHPCAVDALLHAAVDMFRHVLPETMELTMALPDHLPLIDVDANAVQQILLNLATNARDAMDGGRGTLALAARWATPEDLPTDHGELPAAAFLVITVRDNGRGMDAAQVAHACEPFFTTKAPGKGTGLGLSIVFGLIKRMHGFLHIRSELGVGTEVRLVFRTAQPEPAVSAAATPVSVATMREDAAILLVEDDPALRAVAARVLRRTGAEILEAGSGDEAWRLLATRQAHGDTPPRLIVSDIVMPGGGGARVLAAAQRFAGHAHLIWMTGYVGADYDRSDVRAPCAAPIIQKPWSTHDFLAQARAGLEADPNIPPATSTAVPTA